MKRFFFSGFVAGRFLLIVGVFAQVSSSALLFAQGYSVPRNGFYRDIRSIPDGEVEIGWNRAGSQPTVLYMLPVEFPGRSPTIMSPAKTKEEARKGAAQFINSHPEIFGVSIADLSELSVSPFIGETCWLINAFEVHDSVPVLGGEISLAVTRQGKLFDIQARLFPAADLAGLRANPELTSEDAVRIALDTQENGISLKEPSLVFAFRGINPVPAWQVFLGERDSASPESVRWVYTIAGDNGEILGIGDTRFSVDLHGDVKAKGTDPDSLLPDVSYNPPVGPFPMANLTVDIIFGPDKSVETDDNGNFVITDLEASEYVWVRARCVSPAFKVLPAYGNPMADIKAGYPDQYFPLRLNSSPTEETTSQVNAFVWMEKSRDYADYLYSICSLAVPQRHNEVKVNVDTDTCNAFYYSDDYHLEFLKSEGGCVNSAYSTIVAHEFGHHFTREISIMDTLFTWQANHGPTTMEGCADTFAIYLTEQPCVGQDFRTRGQCVRDLSELYVFPTQNYSDPHEVGRTLAGSFWDLRERLRNDPCGIYVVESLFTWFVEREFRNKQAVEDITEVVGEEVVQIDVTKYGGSHKQEIIDSFLPHNLYRLNFIRGDVNGDLSVDIADLSMLSSYVNIGEPEPGCLDAADINNDNAINQDDVTLLSNYLYGNGAPPAAPFPKCGKDEPSFWALYPIGTLDPLTCLESPCSN